MPHFETFKKSLIPLRQEPRVTVQRRGTITINAAAFAALGAPQAVELLFDRAERVLGMRAIAPTATHASFVRPSERSGSGPYVISAMAFLKYYAIDTSVARRWTARLEQDVLCVDLDGEHVPVGKPGPAADRPVKRPRPRPSVS